MQKKGLARLGRPFWKAVLISYVVVWSLDLLTSYILVSSSFAALEGNDAVRTFFLIPNTANFVSFVMNQSPYLFILAFALIPPILHWITKSGSTEKFYAPVGMLLFLLTLERLNFGVCSNAANLIAIVLRMKVPASGDLYYELWGVMDLIWAILFVLYLLMKRNSQNVNLGVTP